MEPREPECYVYKALIYFRKLQAEGHNVKHEIAALMQCLKFFQKQEGDRIRKGKKSR